MTMKVKDVLIECALQLAAKDAEIERLNKRDEESKHRAEARRQELKRTRKRFRACEEERDALRADKDGAYSERNKLAARDAVLAGHRAEIERLKADDKISTTRRRKLHSALDSAEKEVAALRADKERLDWLEEGKGREYGFEYGFYRRSNQAWTVVGARGGEFGVRSSLREAIDDVREKT